MENGQKTIFELFSGEKRFIVPKYQRAYAWEDKEISDFLEDIINQRYDKDYFLGTILFQDAEGVIDGFEHIYIVDGQQRLTTIIIFMKALIGILSKNKRGQDFEREIRRYLRDKDVYKLELIHPDNEFFKTYIIEDNELDERFLETPSQRKLLNAKKYFLEQLSKMNKSELIQHKEKVEKTKILTYSVRDDAEATLIFETTNDRGKSLTNLEKTKSFLMHKVYITKENPFELLDSIHDRFSIIYRVLEEIDEFLSDIDEDNILQYHFISHFQWSSSQKNKDYQLYMQKTKEHVNSMLKSSDVRKITDYVDRYTRELKETFETMRFILADKNKAFRDLYILERIAIFYPLLIKCYKLDKSKRKDFYYEIVKLLEIFSFRVYGVGGKPSYTARDWFYSLARDFGGDFEKLKYEIRTGIIEYVPDNIFREKLSSPYLYQEMRGDLKYLFWKYENYLRTTKQPKAAEMSEKEFLEQNPKFRLDIEHIACQTPKVTTAVLKLPRMSKKFEEQYLHSIGNLAFDPHSANASKGNEGIEIKVSKYFVKAPFKIQNELDSFRVNNQWTESSIQKRADAIIQFALELWNPKTISCSYSPEQKKGEESNIMETLPSKYEHRVFIKRNIKTANKIIKSWDFGAGARIKKPFSVYQKSTGDITSCWASFISGKDELIVEIGLLKEHTEKPFVLFVDIYSRKKSERIAFKIRKEETSNFLQEGGFIDKSLTDNKPWFRKIMDGLSINEKAIEAIIFTELNQLAPIIKNILVD